MKVDKSNIVTHTKYWSYKSNKYRLSSFSNKIRFFLKYIINKLFLNNFGFAVVQKNSTFRGEKNSYINNLEVLSLRNEKISDFLISFGLNNGIKFNKSNLLKNIERYEKLFRTVKISDLSGGMGFNNGLFLYLLICHFNPKIILESGIWRGYSTFLIDDATVNNAKIFCFDINLNNREFYSKKASYFENDLSLVNEIDFNTVDLAFFDDHVSIYDRLKLCLKNKIEIVIVDDDVSLTQVHSDGWPPIPTASMIYNYYKIPKKFEWINNNFQAKADITGLEVDDICKFYKYIPFPQLAEYTGYLDTSLTSLLLRH